MKNLSLVIVLFLASCSVSNKLSVNSEANPKNVSLNGKLFSSLFIQRSAEYRALCLQGYNIARYRIETFKPRTTKPKAIITDIDETILDNSPYAVHQAYLGKEYEANSWYEWTDKSSADTLTGAASLLKYAASKGITVFYITNREDRERTSTLKNLQKFNLPDADESHLLTKSTTSVKEERRQNVIKDYEVILLMGDNLADFSSLFDKKTEAERKANANAVASDFGKKFIVFPNPNYGDWESSLYEYNYKLTQSQKDSVLRSVLKGY